jgi:salicylate hydroxylase
MEVRGIPPTPTFWKHLSGLYVFTCPLGHNDFEVTARVRRPKEGQERVSWGKPFDLNAVLHEYDDFCLPVRQILLLAAKQKTQEFDLFSGRRLERLIAYGNIALIGDASHPLSGNFGSGVGFALEDVYTLCKALDWAWSKGKTVSTALSLFDSVRSPHYKRLYAVLDRFAAIKAELKEEDLSIDAAIEERVKRVAAVSESWMYLNDIEKSVAEAIQQYDERQR